MGDLTLASDPRSKVSTPRWRAQPERPSHPGAFCETVVRPRFPRELKAEQRDAWLRLGNRLALLLETEGQGNVVVGRFSQTA